MWERIKQILIKEFIQIFRDPRSRAIIFAMPIFQVIVFGYAVTTDVKHVSTAVYDLDNSVASRELVTRFVYSGYFDIDGQCGSGRANSAVDWTTVQVQALLRVNKGFDENLKAGQKGPGSTDCRWDGFQYGGHYLRL